MIPEVNETRKNLVFEDHQIPIGKVSVYDTRFTVPSNGIVHRIYDLGYTPGMSPVLDDPYYPTDEFTHTPVLNGTVDGGGRTHVIFEDWETGVASAVSGYYFAVVYEGYFYARETGTYNFKIDCVGGAQFYFDTNSTTGFTSEGGRTKHDIETLAAKYDTWTKTDADSEVAEYSPPAIPLSLTAGQFYKFRLKYWNKLGNTAAVVASFSAPSMDGTDYIPLSAGNCSDYFYKAEDNDYFLEPVDVLSVVHMSGQRRETDAAAYNFTVRMTNDQEQNAYNAATDAFGSIKKDMLVKFRMGYSSNEYGDAAQTSDFITRFTGFITSDVTVNRDKYGANVQFSCHDFKNRLINSPNMNYPNVAFYLYNQYYHHDRDGDPDGFNRVRFFDRWPLEKAIKTLLIAGGIDPQLVVQKHQDVTVDSTVGDTILDSIHVQDIKLESRDNYAKGSQGFVWPDEYDPLWSFKFATQSVNDIINELSKNYGFRFSFSPGGVARVSSVDYYQFVDLPTSYDSNNLVNDRGASNYQYLKIEPSDARAYRFYGKRAAIVARRSSLEGGFKLYKRSYVAGAWTGYSPVTTMFIDGETVTKPDGLFSLNFSEMWHVRDGVHGSVSSNPCIVVPQTTDPYGWHEYRIDCFGSDIHIDGLRSYTIDNYHPVRNYTTTNHISQLQVIDNIKDMVNDVFVIGGKKASVASSVETATHVPQEHVFYRAVDVRSQLDPDYKYYRGRKIPVIIKEPKITQIGRAQWLAESTLERYRTNALLATFSGVGDPYLEVFDPITVDDVKTKVITSDKKLWVVGFSETLSKGQYTISNVETTPRPPVPSFIKQDSIPEFISDNYPNKAIAFENIYFTGSHTDTESEGEFGEDAFGSAPFGGEDYNYIGTDFSKRIHFKPYEARENGDVMVFEWTMLKRGLQYLEIWDSRVDKHTYEDPYVAAQSDSDDNLTATASDFEDYGGVGRLLAVVYLNTEGVPDEPGNYSVTWDTIFEKMEKSGVKWANQTRYKEPVPVSEYDEEQHGIGVLDGPDGANLFAVPYFDTTGGVIAEEDYPHRSRTHCAIYPLRLKYVHRDMDGLETSYWWGTQRLNSTFTDFTDAHPYYIHTLQMTPRFEIDFDFCRVKPKDEGGYEVLDDLYIDNWFNASGLKDSDDVGGLSYSHNHPLYSGGRQTYVSSPTYYNHSKFINVHPDEDHKFGIYLTCQRPNQRLQVVDARLGYISTHLHRMKVTRRAITGLSDGGVNDARFVNPTTEGYMWILSQDFSGDLRIPGEVELGATDGVDDDVTKRTFNILASGNNNPFSRAYSFRRFDSTYNLTSPLSDLRNVFVVDIKRDSPTQIPLFDTLSIYGNPPLDSRYLFHPIWQGGIPGANTNYRGKSMVPISNTAENRGIFGGVYEGRYKDVMTAYFRRKSEANYGGDYRTPKSLNETFHALATASLPFTPEGYMNSANLYIQPNDYVELHGAFAQDLIDGQQGTYEYATWYTAFPDNSGVKIYNSYRLTLHMHVVDEGGRVYRVVDDDTLDLGEDADMADLEHSYSGLNTHFLKEGSLPANNPDSTYVEGRYYFDYYPTAVLGRANVSHPTINDAYFVDEIDDFPGSDHGMLFLDRQGDFERMVSPFIQLSTHRPCDNWSEEVWNGVYEFLPVVNNAFIGRTTQDGIAASYERTEQYEYNMLLRGDVLRLKGTIGEDPYATTKRCIFPGDRFFAVHDTDKGVDLDDEDIDFIDYH